MTNVLRTAYVNVAPKTDGFDVDLKEQLRRKDPGGKAGKLVGSQLNAALRRVNVETIDIKANPRDALAAIAVTEERLKALSRDSATVEVKVRTERALGELRRFKKSLGGVGGDAGPEAASGFAASFSQKLGPLLAKAPLSGPVAASLVGAAVLAAPLIGATVSGAVIGGAGLGGVAGGLILAAKDPRVKAAATEVGTRLQERLRLAGASFVGPALDGLKEIEKAVGRINIEGILRDSSRFVQPLTEGISSALVDLGTGIEKLIHNAGPVVDSIGRGIAAIGKSLGDGLASLSDNGDAAASALDVVFKVIQTGVDSVFLVVNALTEMYGFLKKIGALGVFAHLSDGAKKVGADTLGASQGVGALAAGAAAAVVPLESFDNRMRGATAAVRAFSDAMHAAFSDQLALDQATLQLAEGAKTLRDELTHGTRTLSLNSVEGRTNRAAVLGQLSAIESLRQARVDETGSTQIATAEYNKNITALRRSMLQAGFSKAAVDALIGSYRKIPGKVNTTIGTPGLPQSDTGIKNYRAKLDALARRINTNVTVTGKRKAEDELKGLLIMQRALKGGISVSAASSAFNKQEAKAFAEGGYTGPGGKYQPAGVVHAGEYVFNKQATSKLGVQRLDQMHKSAQARGYASGGAVLDAPFPVNAAITRIPSRAEAMSAVVGTPGNWPSSPGAQRGDSGVWRSIVALIKSTGFGGSFGNAYRPGDPLWHGSGRAVDWMGFNQDPLASFLAARRPLELIHRTNKRDYAYTRGVNKGSFNNSLMEAHRNHVHIAMDDGGFRMLQPGMNLIPNGTGRPEPIAGPKAMAAMSGNTYNVTVNVPLGAHPAEAGRQVVNAIKAFESSNGTRWRSG